MTPVQAKSRPGLRKRLPPGPRAPSAWQLFAYGRDAARFLESNRQRFGPIFRLRFPLQPDLVVICDADVIAQLLRIESDDIPPFPANHAIKSIFGPDSLLFKSGEAHRQDRSLLTPHFTSEASLNACDTIRQQTGLYLKYNDRQRLEVYPWAYRLTLRLTLLLFWGCRDPDLITRIEDTVELSRQRYESYRNMILDTVAMSPDEYPVASRLLRIFRGDQRNLLRRKFSDLINEHVQNIRHSPESYPDCPLVTRLSNSPPDAPVDDSVVDFAMTVLIAAYDPPAATSSWLLLELAKTPEYQRQIRLELADGNSTGVSATLNAFIQEVYRMYPPLHSITRTLKTPTELGGFRLPAGTFVLPSIYLLHRESKYWDAPSEFRPERFLNRKRAFDLDDGYLPFGAGARTCPGRHFATILSGTIAGEVLRHYQLTSLQDELTPPKTLGPTLVPDARMAVKLIPVDQARSQNAPFQL